MSNYKPLSVALRPEFFRDFVYNEPAISIVKNMLANDTLPNGLILSGIRGVGKTTLARIVSRSLNCTNRQPDSAEPCGECESCKESLQSAHPDILEIDGATHSGVDDIRRIIDSAYTTPLLGNKKVYILDEAHNLARSVASWDTLLKILEEPPDHVFWIFCTTQKHKIPDVIKSRLVTLDLKSVPESVLSNYLYSVMQWMFPDQDTEINGMVSYYVSISSGNSIRDALTLLEKVIPYCKEKGWIADNVWEAIGSFDTSKVQEILNHLASKDSTKLWALISSLIDGGIDPEVIYGSINTVISGLILANLGGRGPYENIILPYLSHFPPPRALVLADIVLKRQRDFDISTRKSMVLQVMVLELCNAS